MKSNLNSLNDPIANIESVKKMNERIMGGIIGFTTHTYFRTLYYNAWRSGVIQFLNVFTWYNPNHPARKTHPVNEELLSIQAMSLINFLRYYSEGGTFTHTDNFVIFIEKRNESIRLDRKHTDQEVKNILSDIYSIGFRRYFSVYGIL